MTIKAVKKLRDDPVFFAKLVMGWTPFPYQEKLLRANNKRIAALWGRQSGKTTTIAMKTIHFIYTHPGVTVLIVSKGLRQSMIMFGVIANMIMSTSILRRSVIRNTRTQIEIKNRSIIVALPCSQSGFNLRGYTADMVIMDEAAFMPESVITSVIFPMLATTEKARGTGIAIMISTPWGREHIFYRCYQNPEWFTQHVKSADCPLITEGYLREMRGLVGELRFDTEYNAVFREDATALFTQDMIRGAIEDEFYDARVAKNLPQLITDNELLAYDGQFTGEHCMGIDIGKRRDFTVVSIFRKANRTVSKELWRVIGETKQDEPDVEVIDPAWVKVYMKVFPLGTLLTDAVKHCIWLTKKFSIYVAYIDQTQVGEMPFEVIRANFPQLKGAYLTAQEKQNVMMSYYLMVEERRVGIPYGEEYKEILAQMAEQQYGYSQVRQTRETEDTGEKGVMTFWHPDGRHDDILWSDALAIYGVAQEAGYRSWKPPKR